MERPVVETANLHPQTVTDAERHAAEIAAAKKKSPLKRASRVTKTTVNPRVWHMALVLSQGDHKRIKVLSETSVLVVNK